MKNVSRKKTEVRKQYKGGKHEDMNQDSQEQK
jgi:hypothetical protein